MNRSVFGESTCQKCGLKIAFYRLPNGKACPCNPDGSDHWDTCRDVRYARAKKGTLVTRELEGGGYVKQWETPGEKPFIVEHSTGAPK